MYKDRILDKYEQIKLKHVRLEGLTKQEVLSMQMGEAILNAAHEPTFTKTLLVEDLKCAIKANKSIRMTKELYDKIMKFKDSTVVMVTKEIHRGTILYDVEDVEKLCDDIFATDKKTKTTTDKLITVTKYEYDIDSITGKGIVESEGKIEVNPKYITYTEHTFKFGKNDGYVVNPDYWIINISPDNHIVVNKKDHDKLINACMNISIKKFNKNEFGQEIPGIFETDINEMFDFVKHKGLSKEFADWKFER
jgi:hypothetical protein